MAKKRYTHRQIRHSLKTNELQDFLQKGLAAAKNNTENLLISAIILGVLVIMVPMYFRHQAGNEMRASNLLDRAISISLQPLNPTGASFKGEGFQTLKEKYQKTREAFAEVSATYRNTRAARLARMGEANALFYLQEYESALALYRELLPKHSQDMFGPTIQERIGVCLENLQRWREAKETYAGLLSQSPDYFNRRAVNLGTARCQFHLGDAEAARNILQKESETEPGSPWAETARRLLAYEVQVQP